MPVRAHVLLLILLLALRGRFLFRREKKPDANRIAALDELFESLRYIVATAAMLKSDWESEWQTRDDVTLPPKFQQDKYLYPRASEAAQDAKYTRALLYQNRWNSQIDPLFETFDPDTWTQVRATIERSSAALVNIREAHWDAFRADEVSWINRAVEGLDEARYVLRNAERQDLQPHEVISGATYQTLYAVLQLSETMLDGLRREAEKS